MSNITKSALDSIGKQFHVTIRLLVVLDLSDEELESIFEHTPLEVRQYANKCLGNGMEYLPTCDSVDTLGKCQGHIVVDAFQ